MTMEPLRYLLHPGGLTRREFARLSAAAAALGWLAACGTAADSEGGAPSGSVPWRFTPAEDDPGLPAEPFEVVIESGIRVPMRDGLFMATDVHRPARDGVPLPGPFPVILERTPYGKALPSRSERSLREPDAAKSRAEVAELFVRRGYVVVYQDTRGRYDSDGYFSKYLDDAPDGVDCAEWILAQSWCDGRIGTKGLSYAAHTQGAMASAGAPGIAAMFLDSGGFSNSYQGGIRQGGAFELKQATWAYRNALVDPVIMADPERLAALQAVDIHAWFRDMPWAPGRSPVSLAPMYEEYLFEQWTRGDFDDYWKQPGIWALGFHDRWPDCPMVHMSSWYDPYPRTAVENYLGLRALKRSPIRLILGPWTHGDRSLTWAGDVDFGAEATLDDQLARDYWELRVRWFDHWLRGIDNGVDREPAVRYFRMGGGSGRRNGAGRLDHGGSWRAAGEWPVPGTRFTPYHLHADGLLSPEVPAEAEASLAYDYDPRTPVPAIGGTITSGAPIMVGGAFDQREEERFFGSTVPGRPLADRPDVLVFQTPPLEAAVELTGPLIARLWISSDAPDTDFTVKLVDVYPPTEDFPDGFAMNITDGILRCRYRDSWEEPSLMEPGQVYEIEIEAFPTSNLFAAGHRIRIDISSSKFPHFDLNFNTGEPEGMATRSVIARNTVHLDRGRPSHVVLPIVPVE